jgi:hypothetical protein
VRLRKKAFERRTGLIGKAVKCECKENKPEEIRL